MSTLPEFFRDKQAQKDWADFIVEELNQEALKRVYSGKDTVALKEAKDIILKSFAKLAQLYTPKKERKSSEGAV